MSNAFPFEVALFSDKEKSIFINTVEEILKEDLQNENSFGCKINDCHMHVGSKKHLSEFVEAELLFHNSYYNKRFAILTTRFLEDKIVNCKRVVLVGYETFCELYLRETITLLMNKYPDKIFEYYVIETTGKEGVHVRSANKTSFFSDSYIVFIAPINTTLTTHDKLMSTFCKDVNKNIVFNTNNSVNLSLIMIAPMDNNDYWEREPNDNIIKLKKEKQKLLKNLGERPVYYFSEHNIQWADASQCEKCYPDITNKSITEETPIFEVNRESIVPMLQLGINHVPEPLNFKERENECKNIKRIVELSKYMYHRHIKRNGNHYQYYFDTQTFFHENSFLKEGDLSIINWLKEVVKIKIKPINKKNQEAIEFDFLVAPRHYSNAGFVQFVNDYVFNGTARILYFDVGKEYRDNIKAKYSDFTRLVKNIVSSRQKSNIRFHYVDDTIYSGANFIRTKSLINSLIDFGEDENKKYCNKQLFASIIILIGRNSLETRKSYIDNVNNYFEFLHLSISPMRNHGDACTLCQLVDAYKRLECHSATNQMASWCHDTKDNHKLKDVEEIFGKKCESGEEKRLRLIIRHLLAERLNNKWWLDRKNDQVSVDSENIEDIYGVLNRFYDCLPKELEEYETFEEINIKIALIKVITRPFFTYHIRRRQAAFTFCLKRLERILTKKQINANDKIMIKTFINALSDMNSNYLIRLVNVNRILRIKELRNCYYKSVKKIIGLSMDDSKSILLEYILVHGSERRFFKHDDNNDDNKEYESLKICVDARIALYMENNAILIEGFDEITNKENLDYTQELPYYLNKFEELFSINNSKVESIADKYKDLRTHLKNKEKSIQQLGKKVDALFGDTKVQTFLRDENENHTLWERYLFLGDEEEGQMFYEQTNLVQLEKMLQKDDTNSKNHYILDTIFFNDTFCVVKIDSDAKESIYFKVNWLECKETEIFSRKLEILFSIKILLTLRQQLIEFLTESNVSNVKRLLYDEKNKKALSIKKAANHQQTEMFEGQEPLFEIRNVYVDMQNIDSADIIKTKIENFSKQYKNISDRYMLFLSNQFISGLMSRFSTK